MGVRAVNVEYLDLGTDLDRGDNTFVRNLWNVELFDNPKTIPAQYNFWYGKEGDTILKTTEADILATINVLIPPTLTFKYGEAIKPIEVMPCQTREPFSPSAVKGWENYK